MTKTSIEITRDWSDSKRKITKQKIVWSTYTNNVPSEPKTSFVI